MVTETTHVIFDLDGTLINAVDVIIDILIDYASSHGKDLTLDIRKKVANLDSYVVFFNQFFDSLGLSEDIDREKVRNDLIKTFFSKRFQLIAGAERLVKHLHRHNIPMAIATGNTKRHYTILSKQFQDFFNNYFHHVVCGWDDPEVINKKPNPDVYFVCADRFEPKPKDYQNILVVEDSLTGIKGAIASGMKTLLINDQTLCDVSEVEEKVTFISKSFDDFKPETVGLPAYDQ